MSEVLNALFGYQSSPRKKKSAKDNVFEEFEMVVTSYQRSFELFMDIVERNQDRIFFEEDMKMVIKGRMAIYRIDVQSWINALRNPFAPTSFDPVQVHPLHGFVSDPCKACVQVSFSSEQPGIDSICSYIMGLLNDESYFDMEELRPLRSALIRTYGYAKSPISDALEEYFAEHCDASIQFTQSKILIQGTNNWKWRIDFQNPCIQGFKVEYQKPRQSWWNTLALNAQDDFDHSDEFCEIFYAVELLSNCPRVLKAQPTWYHRLFTFRIAVDYPPLAKRICREFSNNPYYEADYTDRWGEEPSPIVYEELEELKEQIKIIGGFEEKF